MKCGLITDANSNLARLCDHFSQLFNVHGASEILTEIQTTEPIVPEPSVFDF
jgi:hypothetical protein